MVRKLIFLMAMCALSFHSNAQVIRAITYNLRFDNPADGKDQWANRKMNVVKLLEHYSPDVFGVQEALKNQLDYLTDAMPEYEFIGVGRDDGEEAGEFSAIFYNKAHVKLIKSGTFWLSDTPDKVSKGWDAALPRICTYALFQEVQTKRKFWMFNTHFDHIGDIARNESAYLIVSKINEMNKKDYPVLLTGDFNLRQEDAPIQYLSKKLNDTYSEDTKNASYGTFNGFKHDEKPEKRIDYIFVNDQFTPVRTAIITDKYQDRFPSDHLPVMAELEMK